MTTNLELSTSCGLSFKAWTDIATENGIVLRMPNQDDPGDYPMNIYSQLRRFRREISRAKGEPRKVVTHIHRKLVSTKEKGKPTKKEYLWYSGWFEIFDHRGVPFHANFEIGKYQQPKVVANDNRKFSAETGEAIGPQKTFAGQETVYTIEFPSSKTERKKLIDEIIGDNFAEEIHYYFNNEDEAHGRSDPTFDYENFISYTIDELRNMSYKGGGSRTPGFWRDKDGQLRDKFGQLVSGASEKGHINR